MAVGDIYRLTQNILLPSNVTAQNVFYVTQDTAGTGTAVDIRDDMIDWMLQIYSPLLPSMTTAVNVFDFRFEIKTPGTCEFSLFTDGIVNITGTLGGANEIVPHGVAFQTNGRLVGSGRVGKKFFPGLAEGVISDGIWISSVLAAGTSAGVGWVTPFTGVASTAGWQPGVWSCIKLLFFEFSGTIIPKAIASYQRRRKPGVGI